MTSDAPSGELVVVSEQPAKPAAAPPAAEQAPRREASEAGWLGSSFDLLNGVEVTEDADDTAPGVFDAFFKEAPPRRS